MSASDLRKVTVVGPFPPPVHGLGLMTAALANELEQYVVVQRLDLAGRARRRIFYHPRQAWCCLRACLQVLLRPGKRGGLVAVTCNGGPGAFYSLLIVAAARLVRRPTTLHHHTYGYIDDPARMMRLICRAGGRRMTHVFLAHAMREDFARSYGLGQPSMILPNAVFVPPRTPRRGVRRRLVIGLLSNLSNAKGLGEFIRTARLLRAEGLEVEMLLAGPIELPEDREAVRAAEAEGILHALGPLYGPAKDAFFDRLDLFLFPTRYRYEAQPTVIYEAFAAGVPVVSFARGAIAEQVGDCLIALPRKANFAEKVLETVRRMQKLDVAGRRALREKVRARHEADTQQGRAILEKLLALAGEGRSWRSRGWRRNRR